MLCGLSITNNLLLTNGVWIATYGASAAISLSGANQLLSQGLANNLNEIVRYNTVQEQSTTNWSSTTVGDALAFGNQSASAQCAFTAWSLLAGLGNHVHQTMEVTTSWFNHNQFRGGNFTVYPGLMGFTNCLWERVYLSLRDYNNDQWYLYNNLFRGGTLKHLEYESTTLLVFDNLFDTTESPKRPTSTTCTTGNNGFVTTFNRFSHSQGNDVTTNIPVFQTSWLGDYYYPTNDGMLSTLINAGSRWATNAGLYHFTTTTNQVKEGSTMVDIGIHYAAVDPGTGLPYDTDGDGAPDYLEDVNGDGNGANDPTSWLLYNPPNNLTSGSGLRVFTPLK